MESTWILIQFFPGDRNCGSSSGGNNRTRNSRFVWRSSFFIPSFINPVIRPCFFSSFAYLWVCGIDLCHIVFLFWGAMVFLLHVFLTMYQCCFLLLLLLLCKTQLKSCCTLQNSSKLFEAGMITFSHSLYFVIYNPWSTKSQVRQNR